MHRRQFIAYGTSGLAGLLMPRAALASSSATVDLTIQEIMQEMVDGARVPMIAFANTSHGPRVPGPVLSVQEGDVLVVRIRNATATVHAFAVPGAPGSESGPIPPGQTRTVTFTAPAGGTYVYLDPTDAPLNRLLGLHGALIVMPRLGRTAAGRDTPYSLDRLAGSPAVTAISALFDAFGQHPRFPGDSWNPQDPHRQVVWLASCVDPRLNEAAARGTPIDPARIEAGLLPRYFTLNGVSGFDSAKSEENVPKGYIGQPTLLRVLNAGSSTHSMHIHGNHVFELSGTGPDGSVTVNANLLERDTWMMPPLARKDVLLPFEQPQDIPLAAYPPRDEPFPLRYPMHCHCEMSQTAGGGSYPQGLVTDWEILGPLRPRQAAALSGGR